MREIKTVDEALVLIRKGFILFEPLSKSNAEFIDPLKPTCLYGVLVDKQDRQRKSNKFYNKVCEASKLKPRLISLPGCVSGNGITIAEVK